MGVKQINEEVLYVQDEIVRVGRAEIESLKKDALRNERKRIRLCTHRDVADAVHEMLIVHTKGTYVRPHRHLNKSESFHLIEGRVDVVLFDDDGGVTDVIPMGDYASGQKFYYRISDAVYHTLIIHSGFVVFHETTQGPFRRADTEFAPWSPDDKDVKAVQEFMQNLNRGRT